MYSFSAQNNIYLTGLTGSGKSTIGTLLASTLQYQFQDIDVCVEYNVNLYVYQILVEFGEHFFREQEKQVLKSLKNVNHELQVQNQQEQLYQHQKRQKRYCSGK